MSARQLPMLKNSTAAGCLEALRRFYEADAYQWALLKEFSPHTGAAVNRIDALAINCYGSHGFTTIAYEIKVSRSDFLAELKRPSKRRLALAWSNSFYFLAPVGLIRSAEVPVECGLREVTDDLQLKEIVHAPFRDRLPPSWAFVAALARRVVRVEKLETVDEA